jgi:protein SCO1/2
MFVTPFVPTMQIGDAVPGTRLIDQTGRAISLQAFRGSTLVISFIYTRCPDPRECPLVSAKFKQLQNDLRTAPVHLVELTLDPKHDSAAVLRRYGAYFDANPRRWTLATGRPDDVRELEQRLGVFVAAGTPSEPIVHTESVVLIDDAGRIADRIDGVSWNVDDVAARARALSGTQANAIALLRLALSRGVSALCGSGGVAGISVGAALLLFAAIIGAFGIGIARIFRMNFKSPD